MSDIKLKQLFILVLVLSLVLSIKIIDVLGYSKFDNEFIDNIKADEENLYSQSENAIESKNKTEVNQVPMIMVYITGAINAPGVYELPRKSRVCELIDIAGGFTEDAQKDVVNLADFLYDAQQIIVPRIGEDFVSGAATKNKKWTISDLNRASAVDLESINGIGPSTAQKIISYRESHGHFNSLDELSNISGIGHKTIEGLKEFFIAP